MRLLSLAGSLVGSWLRKQGNGVFFVGIGFSLVWRTLGCAESKVWQVACLLVAFRCRLGLSFFSLGGIFSILGSVGWGGGGPGRVAGTLVGSASPLVKWVSSALLASHTTGARTHAPLLHPLGTLQHPVSHCYSLLLILKIFNYT